MGLLSKIIKQCSPRITEQVMTHSKMGHNQRRKQVSVGLQPPVPTDCEYVQSPSLCLTVTGQIEKKKWRFWDYKEVDVQIIKQSHQGAKHLPVKVSFQEDLKNWDRASTQ